MVLVALRPDRELLQVGGRETGADQGGGDVAPRIVEPFGGAAVMRMPIAGDHQGGPVGEGGSGPRRRARQAGDGKDPDREDAADHFFRNWSRETILASSVGASATSGSG